MRRGNVLAWASFIALLLLVGAPARAATPEAPSSPPETSAGFEGYRLAKKMSPVDVQQTPQDDPDAPIFPGAGFDAFAFDDNAPLTGGFLFIPPDPMGAAGRDRVIAVVNVAIEARTKAGAIIFQQSLQTFFAGVPGFLGTFAFDPKIVYDQYADRFVVVALEQWDVADGDPTDESRILLAVSKTSTPATATAADWWYFVIDAKTVIGAGTTWADYPGLEVDEEAVYVTSNMFPFATSAGSFGQRLWIVDKGLVGGFYSGGPAAFTVHDPYGATGIPAFATTTMPAQVFGAAGVGPGIGTFLLSYSGLTYGGPGALEALNVIRVDNPLGAVAFTQEFVNISDIEDIGGAFGFPALADAPQAGGAALIEVNDRRLLDAVWRNGSIWCCFTITPNVAFDPVNANETTAHWVELDASAVVSNASPAGLILLRQEGDAGGDDLVVDMFTFFPSIAVNSLGEMKLGFSGSTATIFAGAYAAGRVPAELLGFTGPTATVRAGVDYYLRTFGGPRNRWGDYSGMSVDPTDGTTFWVFNEWADQRGTPIGAEDGRWGTHWQECAFAPFGQPDLTVRVFESPCCTYQDDPDIGNGIFCEVTNIGAADAGPFSVGFYLSADAIITPADLLLNGGSVIIGGLVAGTSVVVPVGGAQTPAAAPLGNQFLGVLVDESNTVPESDETNNTAANPIYVGANPFECLKAMATTAAAPQRVSVFTVPDGSGRPLNAAQHWNGIAGSMPSVVDATVTVFVDDCDDNPVPGVDLRLFTSQGGLVVCPGDAKSDAPTDAAGKAIFSQAIYGGGYTDPVAGEVARVRGDLGDFAEVLYGQKDMFASDHLGNIHRVDLVTGLSAFTCTLGGLFSTEIEFNPLTGRAQAQGTNGNFLIEEFDIFTCAPLAGPSPTTAAFNGLEWVNGRLYGTGIPGSCANSTLEIVDPLSGASLPIGLTGWGPISGMAYDACCHVLYAVTGCTATFGPSNLLRVDLNTGAATLIGNTQLQLGSLEIGPPGCTLYAGGGLTDGGNLWILDKNTGAAAFVGPTGMTAVTGLALVSDSGLDIQFNSPDINGDLTVNLIDLGTFSADFIGPYAYRSDYYWDGVLNLVDVGQFAPAFGATCPAVIPAKPDVRLASQGEVGIYFDAAGTERTLEVEPHTDVTAYLMVTGKVASAGVSAFEMKIEASDNVVVEEWLLDEGVLNLREAPEFIVGLGGEKTVAEGQPLRLATLRLQVTDREPAHLFVRPATTPSVEGRPAVAVGVENGSLAPLDVASLVEGGAAAAINDASVEPETPVTFAGVMLRNDPNPFNPATEVKFNLPRKGTAEIRIYDVAGREVRRLGGSVLEAGPNAYRWNGTDLNGENVVSGVYYYQLFFEGRSFGQPEKMTLLK